MKTSKISIFRFISATLCCLVALVSCADAKWQEDLADFVDEGLSLITVRSSSFTPAFVTTDATTKEQTVRVASGRDVTVSLTMINPRALEVTYSMTTDADASLFAVAPSVPVAASATESSFSFNILPAAEHRTVTFLVGKYSPLLNKQYADDTVIALVDSPPNDVRSIVGVEDSSARAFVAFYLPSEVSDDDLTKVAITYTNLLTTESSTDTFDVGAAALTESPTPNPLSAVDADGDGVDDYAAYARWFRPDVKSGYPYRFTVTVTDDSGQTSSGVSVDCAAHQYSFSYDGNGNDVGQAPAAATHTVESAVTVADCATLGKDGYAFAYWNTAADGTGTVYRPGSTYAMTAADVTLYAWWVNNGTVVNFDVGDEGLAFSTGGSTVASVTAALGSTIDLACANSSLSAEGTDWAWYLDGAAFASGATGTDGPNLSWNTAGCVPGSYIVSCAVTLDGETYSGSLRVTLTQEAAR